MTFGEITTMDGRKMPRTMKLVPADKPGEFTEIRYDEIDFDVAIPDATFTLQALK
jgi:outer membrane lipoprotein-sorting protein